MRNDVLDTNIIVSAIISPNGNYLKIMDLASEDFIMTPLQFLERLT